jgi:hypothetical protein
MIFAAAIAVALASSPVSAANTERSIQLLQAEAQPQQQTQPQPQAKFYEEPLPPGFARIHLLSDDKDVRLFREQVERYDKAPNPVPKILLGDEMICSTPCGIVVDVRPGQNLYIGGPGMPSTPKFNLVGRSGDVVIDVHGGNYGELILGYIGSWGGFIGAVGAGSLMIVGLLLRPSNDQFLRTAGNFLTVGGGIGVGVGVVFGLTGLYLVHDGRTRYEVLPSGTRPPSEVPATLEL